MYRKKFKKVDVIILKKVEAIIRPQMLTNTIKGLNDIGVTAFTVTQVVGRGQQVDGSGVYRGRNYKVNLHPKVKMEMIVSDFMVERVIETVMNNAYTGEVGDGKIFVYPVIEAYNIRTKQIDTTITELAEDEVE